MTLQEIQHKAQSIIHKWRDDDSAPYIEFVYELAHMIVPGPSADLEKAADNHIRKVVDAAGHPGWDWTTQDIAEAFIAGAKWDRSQMLNEAVEGEIQMRYSGCLCAKTIRAINEDKFKLGDKVRLIVLKAEEE